MTQLSSYLTRNIRWEHLTLARAYLIVGAVLLLSAGIAYRFSPAQLNIVFLVIAAVWGGSFVLHWPQAAMVAIMPVIMFSSFVSFGGNVNDPALYVGGLTLMWLVEMIVGRKRVYLVRSRPILPLLGLVIVAVLAFANGQLPWFVMAESATLTTQLGGLGLYVLSAAAFLLVANQIRNEKWLRYLVWLFLLLGTPLILSRLMPGFSIAHWFQRGAFGSLFYLWLPALALGQVLFNRELKPGWRLFLVALALASFSATWFQTRDWASGWAPALVAIVTLVYLRSWRLGLLLTVAAVGAKLVLDPGFLGSLLEADEYSIMTRQVAWEIVLRQVVSVSPLLGLGPANYYHYVPLFPILGWYVEFSSHNQYIDLVAQTGLLGLFFFMWFAGEVGWLGWRLRGQVPEGFARGYVYGALAGLIGTLAAGALADWVIPFVYNIGYTGFRSALYPWLFLGGLVALEQMYANKADQ